tara:strand:+ start:27527 stop:30250 length:2724 start_codon:yes stop_codon:yes gene_type:complete
MILKEFSKSKKQNNKFYFLTKIYFFISFPILILFLFLFFQTGFWNKNKDEFFKRIHLNGMYNYKYIPKIVYLIFTNFYYELETFDLNISQKNRIILEKNRQDKIDNRKINFTSARASINKKDQPNEIIGTNIRLKGDRPIHYENIENSSYRFNLDNDNYYDGLSSFSLQKPRIRNYIHEWLFHELSGELGLVKLKYKFVNLRINGEKKGLYVLEETFSNNLIEKNNRRAGPIFGLDENYVSENFQDIKLDPYQKNYWNRSSNRDLFISVKNKIVDFINRDLPLEKVVDIKKWANYFALCDLLGTKHGYALKSVKLYYNPISGLIEPIPFDGHKIPGYNYHPIINDIYRSLTRTAYDFKPSEGRWWQLFFYDQSGEVNKEFFNEYLKSINLITTKEFLDSFFLNREKFINKINAKIYLDSFVLDYPWDRVGGIGIYFFSKKETYIRADYLRNYFSSNLNSITARDLGKEIQITNKDTKNNRIIIKKAECEMWQNEQKILNELNLNLNLKKGINKIKKSNSKLFCHHFVLEDKINGSIFYLKIENNISFENKHLAQKNYLNYFNKNNKTLTLKNKFTLIDQNITIPSGYSVQIENDEEIKLINNAFIFSKSNWIVNGNLKNFVKISGDKNNFGGGILVHSNNKSFFRNVRFEYLNGLDFNNKFKNNNYKANGFTKTKINNAKENRYLYEFVKDNNYKNYFYGLRLFGALNIYDSTVEIKNTSFSNIASEDALNIINSNFFIKNIIFENISSDAIDFDFSNGKIIDSDFRNISNDAIDLSGSNVFIQNINLNNINDKSFSSGENSTVKINNVKVTDSFIGTANKDGSKLDIRNSIFKNVQIPFASYTKKKNYNASLSNIQDVKVINSEIEYLLSESNNILLNNVSLKNNAENSEILSIIYRQDKKKLKNL